MKIINVLIIFCIITFCGLAAARGENEYLAVFMADIKVGHAVHSRTVTDGKVKTFEKVTFSLNRLGTPVTIQTNETFLETIDGKPVSFESVQQLSPDISGETKITGEIDSQGMLNLTTITMGNPQKSTLQWPNGAVMIEGARLLAIEKGMNEGTTYAVKVFMPSMMQAIDVNMSFGPIQNVDLLGRVVPLRKVLTTLIMPGAGQMIMTDYVDDDFRTKKSLTNMMGMQFEMIECTKEFAESKDNPLELVNKMFIDSPMPLCDVNKAGSITYYLSSTSESTALIIPTTDYQTVKGGSNNQIIVNVKPVAEKIGASLPYSGENEAILEALKPNRFLQSDHQQIIDLARSAVGQTKDAAVAARKIESFVAEYINSRNLSVGYASATEVAASRTGDCTEFAVLTAAMCRAAGIPAQVVVGMAYIDDYGGLKNKFGGHAWTQAYVNGQWIGLDAAFKSAGLGGFGPGHITMAVGNGAPEDFFNLVNIIGQFRIDKITINE